MTIIEDQKNLRRIVENAIRWFGFAPEHNLSWFLAYADHTQEPVVVEWPDHSVELAYKSDNDWYTFSEPLAQLESRGQRVVELVSYILKIYPNVEKVVTEARENTKQQITENLPKDLRIVDHVEDDKNNYVLTWPVMDMKKFDFALPGGHFKYLRNAKNKFYREHAVEMKSVKDVAKQDLIGVMERWVPIAKTREAELLHEEPYINLIKTGFSGLTTARAMIVDNQVVGFNAGWEIPNSDNFYAGVGIHDYSIQDLGLMLYFEDLEWIKNAGYSIVDMGGVGEGNPLKFKNQFQPDSWYKTYVFTIVRK